MTHGYPRLLADVGGTNVRFALETAHMQIGEVTAYKVADRDGMYVAVSPKGTITFRLDYRLNGRRETLTVGRHGAKDGISLLMARERCMEARRAIAEGQSPSQEKQREKRRMAEAKTFEQFTNRWLEEARMADSFDGGKCRVMPR